LNRRKASQWKLTGGKPMEVILKRNSYADHLPRVKRFHVDTASANFAIVRAVWCNPHFHVMGVEPVAV
jgi:hypothetical protein